MALLEQRKVLSPELAARLRELLEIAMRLSHQPRSEKEREDEVQQAAQQFKSWLGEWRTTAAAVISRRDYLISLGLATRRSSSSSAEQQRLDALADRVCAMTYRLRQRCV